MPLVRRTRAIFRIAEFGFLGVFVVTFVHTPRLNGALKKTGLFLRTLNPFVSAGVLLLYGALLRLRFTSWLMVGIDNTNYEYFTKVRNNGVRNFVSVRSS